MRMIFGLVLMLLVFGCTSAPQDQTNETGETMEETVGSMNETGDAMEEETTMEETMEESEESMEEEMEEHMGETMEEHMDEMMEDHMGIAMSEFSMHNMPEDCWLLYQGEVYDITDWLPNHPGGADRITPHCGQTTFEEAFEAQHGDTKADVLKSGGVLIGNIEE